MKKIPFEKALPFAFYALLMIGIGVIGYVGLSRQTSALVRETVPDATPGKVIALADCDASSENLCILSTGNDVEGNLLISLKAGLQPMPAVYARLVEDRVTVQFGCQVVESAPRLLYCLGPFSGDISSVIFDIYTLDGDILIASGPLVPGEMVQAPEQGLPPQQTLPTDPKSAPPSSYPSYPAYPSYP